MKNQIKKIELNKNLEIEMLEKQLADSVKVSAELLKIKRQKDTDIYHKDCLIEDLKLGLQEYNELKNMNLFQLILWKLKQ